MGRKHERGLNSIDSVYCDGGYEIENDNYVLSQLCFAFHSVYT